MARPAVGKLPHAIYIYIYMYMFSLLLCADCVLGGVSTDLLQDLARRQTKVIGVSYFFRCKMKH